MTPDTTTPETSATGARRALLDALRAQPGTCAAVLAAAAGIGRSTAGKALAAMEGTLTRRVPGTRDGNRRSPDLWYPLDDTADAHNGPQTRPQTPGGAYRGADTTPGAEPGDTADSPAPEPQQPPATDEPGIPGNPDTGCEANHGPAPAAPTSPTPAVAEPPKANTGRLPRGELRALALAHLQAHPDQAFSPARLARALARSCGAVANALTTLTAHGQTQLVCDKPRRYRAAQQP
jgi:hypothetical protein